MRYTKKLFQTSLLMALMALVGCSSSDEFDGDAQRSAQKTWTVSMVATGEGVSEEEDADPQTRAVFYGGNSGKRFSFIWDDGDEVTVYKGSTKLGTLTPSVMGQESTTLTGTLTGSISAGDELTVYLGGKTYNYTGQDGTLGTLSSKKAYQQATVTVQAANISGSTLSLPVTKLTHAQTYVRFRLTDEAGNRLHPTQLQIFSAHDKMIRFLILGSTPTYFSSGTPLTITPQAENGEYPDELFVGINTDYDADETYTFKAWVGEDIYEGPTTALTANLYTRKGKLVSVARAMTCTYQKPRGGVSPPAGAGPVDLGLPSGTKWANMNIGAQTETDYGTYFAWGETSGCTVVGHTSNPASGNVKTIFTWDTYAWCKGTNVTLTKYCPTDKQASYWWNYTSTPTVTALAGNVPADNKTQLELADDAVAANWGGDWRMPTKEDFDELWSTRGASGYTWNMYSNYKGSNVGWLVTYDATGASIFLPAAGYCGSSGYSQNVYFKDVGNKAYYWSSTLYSDTPEYAYQLYMSNISNVVTSGSRCVGCPIRPVQ